MLPLASRDGAATTSQYRWSITTSQYRWCFSELASIALHYCVIVYLIQVKHQLLSEQRRYHEREVDKQVKAFVVETIQFRNSFDTEGPLVPGLAPNEAVTRLGLSGTHFSYFLVFKPLILVSSF